MTEAMHRVLVVEDDADLRTVLRTLLQEAGYRVAEAGDARRARIETQSHQPDALLVDLGLPDEDGMALIRWLRGWSPLPVVVLSARTQEAQKIAALDAGADDYVTKPFASGELLARLRAATRRAAALPAAALAPIQIGALQVDLAARTARAADGAALHLTPMEFRVLECLARSAGMIVTRAQLLREVWGRRGSEESGSLRVLIQRLRGKLEPDPQQPRYLITEAGLGYRLML